MFNLKDLMASRDSYYYIPLEAIKIEKGFNCREDFGDIEGLAKDIAQNGLIQPLLVRLAPDKKSVYINDGERRFRAINYINKHNLLEGGIHDVKCIIEPAGTNEEARLLKMFSTGVNSKPLTEIEQSEVVYRLTAIYHMSPKEIATRLGRPVYFVKHLLDLHGAPAPIRQAVKDKRISHTAAVKLAKSCPEVQKKMLSMGDKIKVKDVEKHSRGTPSMISARTIREKIKKVEKLIEENKTGNDQGTVEMYRNIKKGLELALGLWEL